VSEGEISLFQGRQDKGSGRAMRAATWRVGYLRQIGARPLAVGIGLDGGSDANGSGDSDNGRHDAVRVTPGLTAWFSDGDLVAARRRGRFGQPECARILAAGSNPDWPQPGRPIHAPTDPAPMVNPRGRPARAAPPNPFRKLPHPGGWPVPGQLRGFDPARRHLVPKAWARPSSLRSAPGSGRW
jgi:hypothetical protein